MLTTIMAAAPVLETLPAISLDDLQCQAAFLIRQDRKYLVPASGLEDVLAGIERTTRVLEIDGRRSFGYTTPYFDDDDLTSYFGALRCRPNRFKVRTRLYVDSGLRQLEVKIRDGRGRTVKHRIVHETAWLEHLSAADRAWLIAFPQVGHHAAGLRHRLTTFYRRATLVLLDGDGRVTIDRELVFARPSGHGLVLPTLAIIETKGTGKATAFDRVLWQHGYRPLSLSKFTVGLGLLAPDLPANRWHRLRQHLLAVAEGSVIDSRACCSPHQAVSGAERVEHGPLGVDREQPERVAVEVDPPLGHEEPLAEPGQQSG